MSVEHCGGRFDGATFAVHECILRQIFGCCLFQRSDLECAGHAGIGVEATPLKGEQSCLPNACGKQNNTIPAFLLRGLYVAYSSGDEPWYTCVSNTGPSAGSIDEWETMMKINVLAPMHLTRLVAPKMVEKKKVLFIYCR